MPKPLEQIYKEGMEELMKSELVLGIKGEGFEVDSLLIDIQSLVISILEGEVTKIQAIISSEGEFDFDEWHEDEVEYQRGKHNGYIVALQDQITHLEETIKNIKLTAGAKDLPQL